MKCPHCKKEIEEKQTIDTTGNFIKNLIIVSIPLAILFSILNNHTSIPLSVEDGLKWNLYLLPMLIVGLFYLVYSFLYHSGKVKGRLLIFK